MKTIYVSSGDIIDIRIMQDPELPKNNKEWEYQIRPKKILLKVIDYDHIMLFDWQLKVSTYKQPE